MMFKVQGSRFKGRETLALLVFGFSVLCSQQAFGTGGGGCGTCNAPDPSCSTLMTTGVDDCGVTCKRTMKNECSAPAPGCGQTTTGTYYCGGACSITGPSCGWAPYGYAVPGDPVYGFPEVTDSTGAQYVDNNKADIVGLAAKGNIIIGDYTSVAFKAQVLPKITTGAGFTQPYVVDESDADLGYANADPQACGIDNHSPCFHGDYDSFDGGVKSDGSERKFYESSLSDAEFRAVMDTNQDGVINGSDTTLLGGYPAIDAVLFTNHAFAGYTNSSWLRMNGSVVMRDDGLVFSTQLYMDHDIRLLDPSVGQKIVLPVGMKRPVLTKLRECPPIGCG